MRGKVISFDLDHAFDRVSHAFLHSTLIAMGITHSFVELIARIAAHSTSRLMVNGHLSQPFAIRRSIRQGDPIAMLMFVIYLQPFLTRLENICEDDLCVAYADDVTVIATSTQKIEQINQLFQNFETVAGAKLNRSKTVAIDVGVVDGNSLDVPWLQTRESIKILGITYTNSIQQMIKMNWDALVVKFAHQVWLHSMRSLTLIQKVVLLNSFISSRMWYLAANISPYNYHIAKITSRMGNFLWRDIPARVAIQQLAREKQEGGLNLHLPVFKCKALLVNRHLLDMSNMPFYSSYLAQDGRSIPNIPCLKMLRQQLQILPIAIRDNPSSKLLQQWYIKQTEAPRIERLHTGLNWKRIWRNVHMKSLSSSQRSEMYIFINGKTEHRQLMSIIQRADGQGCLYCNAPVETLQHKFSECRRVYTAWTLVQQMVMEINGGWYRIDFDDLMRPELANMERNQICSILKLFSNYINFVKTNVNNLVDVDALEFVLRCEN